MRHPPAGIQTLMALVFFGSGAFGQTEAEKPAPSAAAPAEASAPAAETPPGGAETETAEVQGAREAFRLGSALAKEGQWTDALAAFRRSAELRPHPVTTYNIGYCERALGRFTRAYQSFSKSLAPAPSGSAPLPDDLSAQARAYLAEAGQRVARVTVTITETDLALRVDGHGLVALSTDKGSSVLVTDESEASPTGAIPSVFELWLDPGAHVFVGAHPGNADVVESHSFNGGTSVSLRFPASAPAHAARSLPPRAAPAAAGPPDRTWAYVAFGVGGAGLATAGVFTGLTLSEKSDLNGGACSQGKGACLPGSQAQIDRANLFADVATVGVIVGAVGAAAGTYLWLSAKPSAPATGERAAARSVQIVPYVGLGSTGVVGKF